MASMNFNDISTENNNGEYKVGFFNIKNGEEAIVRFAINSLDDFELYTVHPITIGQASYPNRRVSCLRASAKDPIHLCPLCAKGEKVQQRMYIKMIQYVNEGGKIVPKAVVWDRPAYTYAPQIKGYLDSYGPLSNIVCKIVRQGEGLDTKYNIMPNLNPQMYNEQTYVKDFSAFDDFKVLGGMVMDRTFDEINQFILTGSFPQRESTNTATQNPVPMQPTPTAPNMNTSYQAETINPYANMQNSQPNFTPPTDNNWFEDNPFTNPQMATGVPNSTPQMGRPTRYY